MVKKSLLCIIFVIASYTVAFSQEIAPSLGFKLHSKSTKNIESGSVTVYVEANQQFSSTRIWVQNDSDKWIEINRVSLCIGSNSCSFTISNGHVFRKDGRSDRNCGHYYIPPRSKEKWELRKEVWMGRGYRPPTTASAFVDLRAYNGTPSDRTKPKICR